ncbi:MAG: rod-binding protein [Kiloniellaceae bacterium]
MGFDAPPVDLTRIVETARSAQAAQKAKPAQDGLQGPQLRRAAEEFEAVFLSRMLAPMFDALETDGLFGGGPGETLYRSLLVEEYGKAIARSGGIGIAAAVEREILRLQEVDRQ